MLKYFINKIYMDKENLRSPTHTPTPVPTPVPISPNSMKKYIPVRNHLPTPIPSIMNCSVMV